MLTDEDIKKLAAPFPKESVGVKVQSFSKDRTSALLVLYLQHTDVYSRLEEVDSSWSCEATRIESVGQIINVAMRMTVKGVSRENVGEGEDYKSAYSDALKRSAMLFGVGRYLYDSEQVWIPYDEKRDRFKKFTMDDFNQALRPGQARTPVGSEKKSEPQGSRAQPNKETKPTVISEAQAKRLFAIAKSSGWSNEDLKDLLKNEYGLNSSKDIQWKDYDAICKFVEANSAHVK